MIHAGGCHCGRVRFEVEAPERVEVYQCNCSRCRMTGFLHLIVSRSRFRLRQGKDMLITYTFNTHTAEHLFCRVCGIESFYIPRSNPDGYDVDLRCLDAGTITQASILPFDGERWEEAAGALEALSHEPVVRMETERLVLLPLAPSDAEALHALWTDPAVRRYLFDDEIIPRSLVDEEIATSERLMATHGYGLWTARMRDADTIIGFCGYRFFHEPPQLQLLYGLAPAYWGRGLATEAARAMIRRGFDVNGCDRIIASADTPNVASHRVMERAGMRFWKRETVNGLDTVYYEVTRSAQ